MTNPITLNRTPGASAAQGRGAHVPPPTPDVVPTPPDPRPPAPPDLQPPPEIQEPPLPGDGRPVEEPGRPPRPQSV